MFNKIFVNYDYVIDIKMLRACAFNCILVASILKIVEIPVDVHTVKK